MTDPLSLAPYTTLDAAARALEIRRLGSAHEISAWLDDTQQDHRLILGGGSNVVFTRDYPGSVGIINLPGITQLDSDNDHHFVEAGAGVNWHVLVRWTLAQGLPGLENLSLIPGKVGAAPMQNIGAYGVELEQRFDSLEAIHMETGARKRFEREDCGFAYRDSRFKQEPGKWLITRIRLKLPKRWESNLDYAGLREELIALDANQADAQQIAEAVCRIRQRKLPDPATLGNVGSFFKNPVVGAVDLERLQAQRHDLPHWPFDNGYKLSAAWLIEQCGWKGKRHNAAGVHAGHALVLVNHGGATGADVWALAQAIQDSVAQRFGITLEPEPRIV